MPSQTFAIASGSDDQFIYKRNTSWAAISSSAVIRDTTGNWIYVQRDFASPDYTIMNMLLRWNTGALLPDTSTVTAATLRVYCEQAVSADSKSLTAGWTAWDGTSDSDFAETPETGALTAYALSNFSSVGQFDITLSNAATGVSTTGTTYLRLHLTDGTQPTGSNYAAFSAFEWTNPQPELIVTYSLPTTRMAPENILVQTNLTGAVSAIQDDPDAGSDSTWLTAP